MAKDLTGQKVHEVGGWGVVRKLACEEFGIVAKSMKETNTSAYNICHLCHKHHIHRMMEGAKTNVWPTIPIPKVVENGLFHAKLFFWFSLSICVYEFS